MNKKNNYELLEEENSNYQLLCLYAEPGEMTITKPKEFDNYDGELIYDSDGGKLVPSWLDTNLVLTAT